MIFTKRKSMNCLKWCDGEECFDQLEKKLINNKKQWVWVSHCTQRNIVHEKLLKNGK